MKTLLAMMLVLAVVAVSACSPTGACPGGYADPNWCNQPQVGSDGNAP